MKRWWEGQSPREQLQDILSLMQLHTKMSEGNLSIDALKRLRAEIFDRNRIRRKDEAAVLANIEEVAGKTAASDDFASILQTQHEMTRHEFHLEQIAQQQLDYYISTLEEKLDDKELFAFKKTQRAWRQFAECQAEFSSLWVDGGSMQPMVKHSELRMLAIERAAKIKDEIRKYTDPIF